MFAAGSVIWILASTLAVRAGAAGGHDRRRRHRARAAGAAALMPVLALATPCLMAFVVLRAGIQAPLSTINYELGAHGARSAGRGRSAPRWACSTSCGPRARPPRRSSSGAIVADVGARWVFVGLALACATAGLWMRSAPQSRGVPAPA